ncbi:hypothetical protein CBL_07032 [Carabus blaptoides fortunei]
MRSPISVLIFLAILHQVIIIHFANAQDNHMSRIDEDGQIVRHEEMVHKYMYPPMNVPRTQTRQGTQKLTHKKCQKTKHKLLHKYMHHPPHDQAYFQVSRAPPLSKLAKMSGLLHKLAEFLAKLKRTWKVIVSIFKVVFRMLFNE